MTYCWLERKLPLFSRCTSANVAIMASVLIPMLVLAVGVAVDYSTIHLSVSKLQETADSSAIASAREMMLSNGDTATVQAVAENYVRAHLASSGGGGPQFRSRHGNNGGFIGPPTVVATANKENGTVEVSITALKKNAFGGFIQPKTSTLTVSATARSYGGGKTCIIALEPVELAAVEIKSGSSLVAMDCGVQSNSTDSAGIMMHNGASMTASNICSTGGVQLNGGITSVTPVSDCPVIEDPLAYKVPPPVGSCDYIGMVVTDSDVVTLDPGVYCGGLTIKKFAQVDLRPGVYVMKDGPLRVTDEATFIGTNVGFYFLGDASTMSLRKDTTIELTAPKSGPMAGLLMFSDRSNLLYQSFAISSNYARVLLGTIYLPNGKMLIDSNSMIGDKSAYTVIVARRFITDGEPEIVINSNYHSTDIPVPSGVGPGEWGFVLIK